jgi:hypothetical protein
LLKPFACTCGCLATGGEGTGESVVLGTPPEGVPKRTYGEQIQTIQKRLATELSLLDDSIKAIRNPEKYHVEFT